jgi:hypothetical protein
VRPHLKIKSWVQWCASVIPVTAGNKIGGLQCRPAKITRAKRAGGVAQVVEYLLSKCEALSSNPSTEKKKKKEKEKALGLS